MGCLDRPGKLDPDIENLADAKALPCHPLAEIPTGTKRHHKVWLAVTGNAVGQHLDDVRVVAEHGHRVRLIGELTQRSFVELDALEDLDRDLPFRTVLLVQVHNGVAAAPQRSDIAVPRDRRGRRLLGSAQPVTSYRKDTVSERLTTAPGSMTTPA